jgi:hypothetical protein
MDEFLARQFSILRELIKRYFDGALGLDALIQRIEGLGDAIGIEAWKDVVFPLLLSMEQINAVALEEKRNLTAVEKRSIEQSLTEMEALVERFASS